MRRGNSWSGGKKRLSGEKVHKQERLQEKSCSEEVSGCRLEKLRQHTTTNSQYELELSDIQEMIRKLDKDNREAAG